MNDDNLIPAKKGDIRNPKGKKKGTKNYKTIAKKFLNLMMNVKDIEVELPYKFDDSEKLSLEDIAFLRCLKRIIATGDMNQLSKMWDRRYGLQSQKKEISGSIQKNINITDIRKAYQELQEKKDDSK